ncbi:MAG: NADH-quinone oxidoreductase subunit A [Candidatus Methylarchaceae archaeon HK01B]|nr:NADH-quinone oxidoreductase subunit A [Candidatus Methylarchaceae archaeon HK01M]MCP8312446.1 NADH-quinone oxidoreductase subunit A [Candidatus Methylarchaceae archaeon HK02M1]MCP8319069.1 NADH-quinone oxidoreductase subunit A [Candidatus Methylarchaceae archaeon HK01B]
MSASYFDLLALAIYSVLSALTPIGLYSAGLLLGEKKPSAEKNMSFECGQVPVGRAHMRVTVQYYPYALIYGVFTAFAIFMLISAPGLAELELKTKLFGQLGLPFIAISVLTVVAIVASYALRHLKLWRS